MQYRLIEKFNTIKLSNMVHDTLWVDNKVIIEDRKADVINLNMCI